LQSHRAPTMARDAEIAMKKKGWNPRSGFRRMAS
jgi:hypothetical protein